MQVTNLAYFYETSRKVRGGKWVWVKDGNGEQRGNVLLGGTILNPNKGFGHLWAAQLVQYTPAEGCLIFRSFELQADAAADATTIYLKGDGYSDAPEVGMYLMVAPEHLYVETFSSESELTPDAVTGKVDLSDAVITKTETEYKGAYAKVTAVEYDETNEKFKVTLENKLSAAQINAGTILVEADYDSIEADLDEDNPTGLAPVLVPNPNTFVEADRDLMPTEGYGIENANYAISTVYNKQAWIARMQPLPQYVLDMNKSNIDGIFWI